MSDELDDVLSALHENGYESITRDEGFDSASGSIPLPTAHRREPRSGWRRLLPRVYDGGDPDLVADDLRSLVVARGYTVQPMGRNAETVTVVVSENGV